VATERINPSDVYEPFGGFYSQVITATGSRQVYVAGTVALDVERTLVAEGDMRGQVRVIMENVGRSLAAAGAEPRDVVRINIFALDVDSYLMEGHQEVVAFFGDTLPTSTLAGVTRLADPRYLVEIQATAVVD
jgi:enamine deaminase RidA (YjgF/YER057c/UK114 family)